MKLYAGTMTTDDLRWLKALSNSTKDLLEQGGVSYTLSTVEELGGMYHISYRLATLDSCGDAKEVHQDMMDTMKSVGVSLTITTEVLQ